MEFQLFQPEPGIKEFVYLNPSWMPIIESSMFNDWLEWLKHDSSKCIECGKELTPFLEAFRCTRCEHFHQMDLADERGY